MNLRRFLSYFGKVQSFEPETTRIRFTDSDGRNLAVDLMEFDAGENVWKVTLKPAPLGGPINGNNPVS